MNGGAAADRPSGSEGNVQSLGNWRRSGLRISAVAAGKRVPDVEIDCIPLDVRVQDNDSAVAERQDRFRAVDLCARELIDITSNYEQPPARCRICNVKCQVLGLLGQSNALRFTPEFSRSTLPRYAIHPGTPRHFPPLLVTPVWHASLRPSGLPPPRRRGASSSRVSIRSVQSEMQFR